MADLPPTSHSDSDTGNDTDLGFDRRSPPGTPRWVKVLVFVIITLLLAGLVVAHLLTGLRPH